MTRERSGPLVAAERLSVTERRLSIRLDCRVVLSAHVVEDVSPATADGPGDEVVSARLDSGV